jgi:hypothetical protein
MKLNTNYGHHEKKSHFEQGLKTNIWCSNLHTSATSIHSGLIHLSKINYIIGKKNKSLTQTKMNTPTREELLVGYLGIVRPQTVLSDWRHALPRIRRM